jgi:hypothetical protein
MPDQMYSWDEMYSQERYFERQLDRMQEDYERQIQALRDQLADIYQAVNAIPTAKGGESSE